MAKSIYYTSHSVTTHQLQLNFTSH